MNDQPTRTPTPSDEDLRALLVRADPVVGGPVGPAPVRLLEQVLADAVGGSQEHPVERRTWLQRHWQGSLLVAATVATLALAVPSVLPGLTGSGADDSAAAAGAVASENAARESAAVGAPESAGGGESAVDTATGIDTADLSGERLVRSASLLVGAEDITAERDRFVATILDLGGRVAAESVVTQGSDGSTAASVDVADASTGVAVGQSYPWYPSGPGIWLTVEVPARSYDEAVQAARSAGEVVRSEQSSYDVGTQITDVNARIRALESSLATLTGLMDEAESISDVVALEAAISARQSELDALKAVRRDLASQTAMSQVSLTLMSPQDALDAVDPQPDSSWWEQFLAGLADLWAWLGRALLILSPLLAALGIIWWVRRRGRRGGGTAEPGLSTPH